MFRAFSRPSSGAQWLQWQHLVLPSCRCDNRAVFVVGPAGRSALPRTQHGYHHNRKVKLDAASAVIELLMMGGETPETCWGVNKRKILNWKMVHQVGDLFELNIKLRCQKFNSVYYTGVHKKVEPFEVYTLFIYKINFKKSVCQPPNSRHFSRRTFILFRIFRNMFAVLDCQTSSIVKAYEQH
jgi:hypothetical protein